MKKIIATFLISTSFLYPSSLFAQSSTANIPSFVPVTDNLLRNPPAQDWLMWRRTQNGWGYSPLNEINATNVNNLKMIWTRALTDGSQTGTPIAYNGVLYMPNPNDVIQALNAVTGDLIWEHRREIPESAREALGSLSSNNRNIAIWKNLIIDTIKETLMKY